MLGTHKTRRLAALLALASLTNAASYVAAQAPASRPVASAGTGPKKPTLIADCDVSESCSPNPGGTFGFGSPGSDGGGSDGGYGGYGGDSSDGCGTGSRVLCRTDDVYECAKWVVVSSSGGGTVSGGATGAVGGGVNGSITMSCGKWVHTVAKLFWP